MDIHPFHREREREYCLFQSRPIRTCLTIITKLLYVLLPTRVSASLLAFSLDQDQGFGSERISIPVYNVPYRKVYLITMLASLNSRPTALPVLGSGTQSALQGHATSSRAPEAGLYSSVRGPPS